MLWCRAALTFLLLWSVGCSKQHPDSGLGPDRLLRHVPGDTPYAFAQLESVPRDYVERQLRRAAEALSAATREPPLNETLAPLVQELMPLLSVESLERAGLSPSLRSIVYGIGLFPAIRIEVRDAAALSAVVDRIVAHLGGPPAQTGAHGKEWRFERQEFTAVLAITDNELLATLAPTKALAQILPVLFGDRPPVQPLDEHHLAELAARHGFRPNFLGYIELAHVVPALEQLLERPLPEPCKEEAARAIARAPRIVFGVNEFSAARIRGGVVLELAPELATKIMKLRVPVPGVAAPLGKAIFSFGAAIDLVNAVELLRSELHGLTDRPHQCAQLDEIYREAQELERQLAEPLPTWLSALNGVAGVLHDYDSGAVPPRIQAAGVLSAIDPVRLLSLVQTYSGFLPNLQLRPDGKPVAVALGPLGAYVAMEGRLLGLAIGDGAELELVRLMSERPVAEQPLFSFAYDFAKFRRVSESLALGAATFALSGRFEFTVEATERGLRLGLRVDDLAP